MTMTVKFHDFVDRYNVLKKPTTFLGHFFDTHARMNKIALIINHLFRASMVIGFMFIPGIPTYVNMSICFIGSLFYRLTVEKNCAYKFALPAFLGAIAFMLALPSLINMINGNAFVSFNTSFITCTSLIPLIYYGAYIFLTVNYDVNKAQEQLEKSWNCCPKNNQAKCPNNPTNPIIIK